MLKKLAIVALIWASWSTVSLAGPEDWQGTFTVADQAGNLQTINHTPTKVSYGFLSAGGCVNIGAGTTLNGTFFPNGLHLCTNLSIDAFTTEVANIGTIVAKNIVPGPTYSSN